MNRTLDLARLALLALGLATFAPACEDVAPPPNVAPAKPQPTAEAALERSRAYWAHVEKGDWLPTYEMLAPETRVEQPLGVYLQNKQNHEYADVRVEEVVGQTADRIFIRVGGLWTPTHPVARKVKLGPGETLTGPFELIEVWRWESDEWLSERRLYPEDFLKEFPDFAPKPTEPKAPAEGAKAPAESVAK